MKQSGFRVRVEERNAFTGGNAFRNAFGQLGGPGKSAENVMQVQAELKDHRTKVGFLFDLSPSSPVSFFPSPHPSLSLLPSAPCIIK